MALFLNGLFLLFVGYCIYGKFVEKILAPDDRATPAIALNDGVDFMVLPHWKNMLIQLLNIAGTGPVLGVILGIKFGPIVFILIPLGNIMGGAVHDFVAGMMSLRSGGSNLPAMIKTHLGKPIHSVFLCVMTLLLILVVAVFINVPAKLIDGIIAGNATMVTIEGAEAEAKAELSQNNELPTEENGPTADPALSQDNSSSTLSVMKEEAKQVRSYFWPIVVAIFIFYILATLFPIDVIIGRFYPYFGGMLLFGTALIYIVLMMRHASDPSHFMVINDGFRANMYDPSKLPIIPCLFVTIACGILSGFHATQTPIVARTTASEKEARASFYGMMVVEGVIAMIWAAAALALYSQFPATMDPKYGDIRALNSIADLFLGHFWGSFTILAVVVLSITSGDGAMRSLRLSLAEAFNINQKPLWSRFMICIPLIIIIAAILIWSNHNGDSFKVLWNYFAWGNQILAVFTFMAGTVWLYRQRKNFLITLLPGAFMMFVVISFILWTSPEKWAPLPGPFGFNLDRNVAYAVAGLITLVLLTLVILRARSLRKNDELPTLPEGGKAENLIAEK